MSQVTGGPDAGRWSGSLNNIHFVEVIGVSPSSTMLVALDGGLCVDLAHEAISVEWP